MRRQAGPPAWRVEDPRVPVAPILFLAAVLAAAVLAFTAIVTADPAPVSALPASPEPSGAVAGATAEEDDGDRDDEDGNGDGNGDGDGEDGDGDGNGDDGEDGDDSEDEDEERSGKGPDGEGGGKNDGDPDGDRDDGPDGPEDDGSSDAVDDIAPDRGFPGDPSSGELMDWEGDSSAYTVVIGSAATKDEAKDRAREAAKAGLPAGVLEAEDHAGLDGDGPWVVFAGRFDSEREAQGSRSAFASSGFPGHVRPVSSRDGGRGADTSSKEESDDDVSEDDGERDDD